MRLSLYICMYVSMNRRIVRVNSLFKEIRIMFRRNLDETLRSLSDWVQREVSDGCVPCIHIRHVKADIKTW